MMHLNGSSLPLTRCANPADKVMTWGHSFMHTVARISIEASYWSRVDALHWLGKSVANNPSIMLCWLSSYHYRHFLSCGNFFLEVFLTLVFIRPFLHPTNKFNRIAVDVETVWWDPLPAFSRNTVVADVVLVAAVLLIAQKAPGLVKVFLNRRDGLRILQKMRFWQYPSSLLRNPVLDECLNSQMTRVGRK